MKGGHGVKNQLIFRSRTVKITHTRKKLENFMFFEVTDFASEGLKVLIELGNLSFVNSKTLNFRS